MQSPNYLPYGMLCCILPMPKDNPEKLLNTLENEGQRRQFCCELAYLRGDFAAAKRGFEIPDDDPVKLCGCTVALAAAISTNDYDLYLRIKDFLQKLIGANPGSSDSLLAEMTLATATMSMLLPEMAPVWLKEQRFDLLPEEARPFAMYLYVKYLQSKGCHREITAVSKVILGFCSREQGFTTLDIYLRLLNAAALDNCGGSGEQICREVKEALELGMPHGFRTPFCENLPALVGILEQLIQEDYPQEYPKLQKQWQQTGGHWLLYHHHFAKDHVSEILTLREYQIAQMLANGATYAKTAQRFHLSQGRLNNIVMDIYGKLGVKKKADLKPFVF